MILSILKKIKWYVWAIVAAILFGLLAGYGVHKPPKSPPCPEIVPQTLYVHDTVIRQPTTTQTVPTASIVPSREFRQGFRQVPATDSAPTRSQAVQEAVNCWTIPVVEPDSAQIVVHLCSRDFGVQPPADLAPTIEYTASPRVHVVERTNNVILPPPAARRWGWTVGPYLGAGITWRGTPYLSAGLAVVWGVRIGKLTK